MNKFQFDILLKDVSRSFYLSMRILPANMRQSIAIAYLLARAADTIADTKSINYKQRLSNLASLKKAIEQTLERSQTESVGLNLDELLPFIDHPGESALIKNISVVITEYHSLSNEDFMAVKRVVCILINGMEKDFKTFVNQRDIVALDNAAALEEYTYLVAGCVGEFWTIITQQYHPALKQRWQTLPDSCATNYRNSHSNKDGNNGTDISMPAINDTQLTNRQVKWGIEFGKALQLTNILRDIAKDARLGRCYLPGDQLEQHLLNCEMLLDKNNESAFRPVIAPWLHQARVYFESAEQYLLAIPRHHIRLRLAALWPILIGLKTLKLIEQNNNFLDENKTIKVKRSWVYRMILLSFISVFSNSVVTHWIRSYR